MRQLTRSKAHVRAYALIDEQAASVSFIQRNDLNAGTFLKSDVSRTCFF